MKAEVSMTERVAETIRKASAEKSAGERRSVEYYVGVGIDYFRHASSFDAYDKFRSELFEAAARAAIEAMRKPTYAMEQAGWSALPRDAGPSDAAYIWEKMIDAALLAEREAV